MTDKKIVFIIFVSARVTALYISGIYVLGLLWFYGSEDPLIVRNGLVVIIAAIVAAILPRWNELTKTSFNILLRISLLIVCVIGITTEIESINYIIEAYPEASDISVFQLIIVFSFGIMSIESFIPVRTSGSR